MPRLTLRAILASVCDGVALAVVMCVGARAYHGLFVEVAAYLEFAREHLLQVRTGGNLGTKKRLKWWRQFY
jgi:hypothetical protein